MSLADVALANATAISDIRDAVGSIEERLARIEGGLRLGAWLAGSGVVLFVGLLAAHVIR